MAPKKAKAKGGKDSKKEKAHHPPTPPPQPTTVPGSADFEAGIMFNKYDKSKSGVVTADDFRQMWKEVKGNLSGPSSGGGSVVHAQLPPQSNPHTAPLPFSHSQQQPMASSSPTMASFEAGQIFSQFDQNGDGQLDKKEFEQLVQLVPGLFRGPISQNPVMAEMTAKLNAGVAPPLDATTADVVSGRILTHYDETAGIPLPQASVDQHKAMGNLVTPLIDAYKSRYDRLRSLLTGNLLPKREHLLQVRRQLTTIAEEVAASRKAIEKESLKDVEGIIERLRTCESLRQSSIHHQVLLVDEELEAIERSVRRVEAANEDSVYGNTHGVLLSSSSKNSSGLEMIRAPRAQVMVELIQNFADLTNQIERLSTKQINIQNEFATDDFPKEVNERLEIIAKCDSYLHAVKVKDQLLWKALQEKESLEEQIKHEKSLCAQYADEVSQWATMSQDCVQEMAKCKKENEALRNQNNYLQELLKSHPRHPTYPYFNEQTA